ncbi:MAG: MBL fold metallo-hydrolase [Proteobacteria bacterium]|nr:MBL fold metallo-hydrolase [Pseudomonadota bacterium]
MKVIPLRGNNLIYTCNSYLVLGSWNALHYMNTLVDVGTDGSIIAEIEKINTGVGKRPVEQVVITHNHFDHAGGIREIKLRYNPKIYAYKDSEGIDEVLKDGQVISMGDREFEVIHTPGHSSDSVCLYCEEEKTLFSGDTPVRIVTVGGSYSGEFISAFEKITRRNIHTIYSGHDRPIRERARDMMTTTLKNMKSSRALQCF